MGSRLAGCVASLTGVDPFVQRVSGRNSTDSTSSQLLRYSLPLWKPMASCAAGPITRLE